MLLETGSSRQYFLLKDRRHWGQVLILKGKVSESLLVRFGKGTLQVNLHGGQHGVPRGGAPSSIRDVPAIFMCVINLPFKADFQRALSNKLLFIGYVNRFVEEPGS